MVGGARFESPSSAATPGDTPLTEGAGDGSLVVDSEHAAAAPDGAIMPRVARRWDARTYDSLALPHTLWGRRTLARLDPLGVSRVLDAGCGTGRDTELLLDLIPDVRVVAVDASRAMLDQLERRVADRRERVEIIRADLTQPLPIAEPVDAIISVAAFHWIADHATLFCNLAIVLRGGGQLVAECGGEGNIASIVAAIDDVLGKPPAIWNFAGVEETERRLADAGFTDIEVALIPDSVRLEEGAQFESYLVTLVLGAHIERLSEAERPAFIRAVIDRISDPVVDHVRLTLRAKKRDEEGGALGAVEPRATPPRLRR